MKIFELQTHLTSYSYSIVKIVVSLIFIILSVVRNSFFHFNSAWANVIITIICFQISILCILCLYLSIAELFHTHSNRLKANSKYADKKLATFEAKLMTIDKVSNIVFENDIIEIEIRSGNSLIVVGTSADCNYSSSTFINKLYYIENKEFDTIESFSEALKCLFPEGVIPVLTIDGLPQN